MRKLTLALMCAIGLSAGAETPLWLRDIQLSPDGKTIAFTYKGDIYKVPSAGGQAIRLTSLPSYESAPVWSPDGKSIAFASDRNGGQDVYIMSADGGSGKRLTSQSASEIPQGFTPDGKFVLFSANLQLPASSAAFPGSSGNQLYSVPTDGGITALVVPTPAYSPVYLPDGKSFLYEDTKGFEDKWRKHHTSSVTRDVWRYDAGKRSYTNLTNHAGEARNPVLSRDGKTVYYLSERNGGSMNVWSFPLDNPSHVTAVTSFKDHPIRFLSGNDELMAFGYNGEIYTKAAGQKPAKVKIDITLDENNPVRELSVSGVREAAPSPSGKQLAYVNRGEVFVTSVDHSSVRRITDTPEGEGDVSWGKDDRELYYVSERDGRFNIYRATIDREGDPNFSNATVIKETRVFDPDSHERTNPHLSPDGKQLAYVLDRNTLMVRDMETGKDRKLTDKVTAYRTHGFDVQWSPDSKWLLLEATNPLHEPYSDIAIINVDNGIMTPLTRTGYFDAQPHWSADGNAVTFLSERFGMRNHASWGSHMDVMVIFMNRDAYDRARLSEEDYELLKEVEKNQKKDAPKKDEPNKKDGDKKDADKKDGDKKDEAKKDDKLINVELDGIEERIMRLTPASADMSDAILSKDGSTLYYLAAFEGGNDLWKINLRKQDASIAAKSVGANGLVRDNDGNIYLIGSQVKKLKNDRPAPISLGNASVKVDPQLEREYMLEYVRREARERFLTPKMPVDWDKYVDNYARFLPHINNNYDYAAMLSELLGELNVSHSGGRYGGITAKEPTASLGLLYAWNGKKGVLTVDEVVAKGPFDRASSDMQAGSTITAINGRSLDTYDNPLDALNTLAGHKTLVSFTTPDGEKHEEVVLPIGNSAMNELLYRRWVRQREHDVDSLSGGRLGYVHIRSMSDASFREVYSQLLGKYIDREGIVIDTRWNGGGRLHEDIEVLFSGKQYLTQVAHGNMVGNMPSRRWNKPSIMVMGEANYSNAHGTPWVYKHMGLGKLVGMPVPGTMSSVNWITLQDPTLVFGVPVVSYRTADGSILENSQLEPDIRVACNPADLTAGHDAQIAAAVKELLDELDTQK